MHRNFRKPLVIAAPKIGLKHPRAVSKLQEFSEGNSFKPTIASQYGQGKAKKVIFCTGKVAFDIEARLEKTQLKEGVLVVRLEEIAPFPIKQIKTHLT